MSVRINKANIQPIPTDVYRISSGQVVEYLQGQLGFCLATSRFEKMPVINPTIPPYVIFKAVFHSDDIITKPSSSDYVDRVLRNYAADDRMIGDVYDVLKKYMYQSPEKLAQQFNKPERMMELGSIGISQQALTYLIQYSPVRIHKQSGLTTMCLRAERILFDMVSDPTTGKIDGVGSVMAVDGTADETIRWDIGVTKKKILQYSLDQMSIDAIFNSL